MLEGLIFRSRYWDDIRARNQFKQFLMTIHGLDLGPWERAGYWDEDYTPFSLFDRDTVVSSVCVYSMDMMLQGRPCRVGQFSGVGTLPQWRRRGLAQWLTDRATEAMALDHAGFFLFADLDAVPFYRQGGFLPVSEAIPVLRTSAVTPRSGLRRLDTSSRSDLDLIHRRACEREPVSSMLGVRNPLLLMFHCLHTMKTSAWEIPDLDLVLFFNVKGTTLTLLDVVGRQLPPFLELLPFLAGFNAREIRFMFLPDQLQVEASHWEPHLENCTHRDAALDLPFPCLFPWTAHA